MPDASSPRASLLETLPAALVTGVRGRLTPDAPLGAMTWFRVGGPADLLFRPADEDDLAFFLASCPAHVPITVIGVASNLLVRDGGVPGVVIRLGGPFAEIAVDDLTVTAGAGALDQSVAMKAQEAGIGGLEFLSGIPGTIGGALRMNAGAYGRETSDIVVSAEGVARDGRRLRFAAPDLDLSYRHCGVADDVVFTRASFRGVAEPPGIIAARMAEIQKSRSESQPVRARTGGSTFANPVGAKAWQLIDQAGCRGLRVGGAQVSEKHCNFLLNTGDATAADLEALGEEVRRRVFAATGVRLDWEIKRIGLPARFERTGHEEPQHLPQR